ncbi:TAXI family TRAP transporter solute-binding subunit [Acidiphilium sp. AL]|uniref:TAXI family TRAP transporter solute-binding subunit n=1 Tax=Acidiphilium iwatense TaxID=768198 RepID=A0ABS9DUQ4_9PROT|nr:MULTISPECIES: TAXI family TRAP transporter solute-binding subunit [Acidiphilium]MCF3946456.1 TAXI family TRAP transporter solute-binding subunit [Acidiphilium iwatense]MCU4158626.1 TAXI family TRAP transporter solute-binding subunit [Acidiphilium sp. AL]
MALGARARRDFIGRRSALGLIAGGATIGVARANPALPLMPAALTMATGEPGGGFALFGPAWGMAAQKGTRIAVSYHASGGSAANILLAEQNAAQLGMTTLAVAAQAWSGHAAWTGNVPLRGFRALFPIFETTLQIFAPLDGKVRHLGDLTGARIGIGPAGGAGSVLIPAMLAAAGISPRLAITGLYAEQTDLLREKRLDACAFFGVTPLPAIRAAAKRGGFTMIGFTRAEQAAIGRIVPGLAAAVIPATSLPDQSAPVATIGSGAIAICRADLPDMLAGRLTDAALAHRAALIRDLPGATLFHGSWIEGDIPVEIHPGAAAALRRHGLAAPARLIQS